MASNWQTVQHRHDRRSRAADKKATVTEDNLQNSQKQQNGQRNRRRHRRWGRRLGHRVKKTRGSSEHDKQEEKNNEAVEALPQNNNNNNNDDKQYEKDIELAIKLSLEPQPTTTFPVHYSSNEAEKEEEKKEPPVQVVESVCQIPHTLEALIRVAEDDEHQALVEAYALPQEQEEQLPPPKERKEEDEEFSLFFFKIVLFATENSVDSHNGGEKSTEPPRRGWTPFCSPTTLACIEQTREHKMRMYTTNVVYDILYKHGGMLTTQQLISISSNCVPVLRRHMYLLFDALQRLCFDGYALRQQTSDNQCDARWILRRQ
jgi:hypothetical protein